MKGKALLAATMVLTCATVAVAQDKWPNRPIRFVVHVAAGGGVDLNARILADQLSKQLPQPVLVENMGGAGGTIAARHVAKSDPDGYTFLFAGPGHASAPFLRKERPYDPIKDFIPVSLVTQFPLVVVVNPKLPAKTMQDFIAMLKAAPGKHTFGSGGVGGSSHIPVEAFMRQAGVKMTHVPFRGNGPSSTALISGQIDMIIDGLAPQLGNIESGRVRVLGVTTATRTPYLPDSPAVSETLPGYQFPMWVGLFAPAKTPQAIVDRLAAEIGKAMQDPLTKKRYADVKVSPSGSTSKEFEKFFREQLKFNEDIIKASNIQQN
jgi:tripartite-type tricarboxylate transporter receptor subunit TctC